MQVPSSSTVDNLYSNIMFRKLRQRRQTKSANKASQQRPAKETIFRKVRHVPLEKQVAPPPIAPAITMTMSEEEEALIEAIATSPRVHKISTIIMPHDNNEEILSIASDLSVDRTANAFNDVSSCASSTDSEDEDLNDKIGNLQHELTKKEALLSDKHIEIAKLQIVLKELREKVASQEKELSNAQVQNSDTELKLTKSLSKISLLTLELEQTETKLEEARKELNVTGSMLVQTQHKLHDTESQSFWKWTGSILLQGSRTPQQDYMRGYFENP